jgi:hypothetical protein
MAGMEAPRDGLRKAVTVCRREQVRSGFENQPLR